MTRKRSTNTKKALLESVVFPVSGNMNNSSLPKQEWASFPAGPRCHYSYSFVNSAFSAIEESVYELTGFHQQELVNKPALSFFSEIIADEHVYAVVRMAPLSYELQTRYHQEQAVVNQEYDIVTRNGEKKRFLFQYAIQSFSEEGYPLEVQGCITDITHIKSSGPPALFVMAGNKMIVRHTAAMEELLPVTPSALSMNEVTVLQLKSNGLRTKEIAKQMGLTEYTVYSIVRNIRRKSGMDPMPLIQQLRAKGLIR